MKTRQFTVFFLVASGCQSGEVAERSPTARFVPTDTVEGPNFPADQRPIGVKSTRVVTDEAESPIQFNKVIDAEYLSGQLVVIDGAERTQVSILRPLPEMGWRRQRSERVSPQSRLDRIVTVGDSGSLLLWDSRRAVVWTLTAGDGLRQLSRLRVSGLILDVFESGDTIWVETGGRGAYKEKTVSRAVQGFSRDGEPLEHVRLRPERREQLMFLANGPQGLLPNFARLERSIMLPGVGEVRTDNRTYCLTILMDGTARRVVAHAPTYPLADEERRWWSALGRRLGEWGEPAFEVPATKPAFKAVIPDHHRRLWVWRHVPSVQIDSIVGPVGPGSIPYVEVPTFDAFGVDGTYLGTLELPVSSRIVDITANQVLMAVRTGSGQEVLKLLSFEIQKPSASARVPAGGRTGTMRR